MAGPGTTMNATTNAPRRCRAAAAADAATATAAAAAAAAAVNDDDDDDNDDDDGVNLACFATSCWTRARFASPTPTPTLTPTLPPSTSHVCPTRASISSPMPRPTPLTRHQVRAYVRCERGSLRRRQGRCFCRTHCVRANGRCERQSPRLCRANAAVAPVECARTSWLAKLSARAPIFYGK